MTESFEIVNGPVRLRVTGLRRTVRSLEQAGAATQDMRDLMHELGMIVVSRARIPVLTGATEQTVRAGRGKTKAVVRAGKKSVPYVGVIHYGWPAHNIEPQPYLVDALRASRGEVLDRLDSGIGEILRKNNLK
jgi:hypothetical protein